MTTSTGSSGWCGPDAGPETLDAPTTVLVPVGAAWVVAEPVPDTWRSDRYRALARAGVTRKLSAIVVDTIPAASPELVPPGTPAAFADYVSAIRGFDAVVAMGDAVAAEWRGITAMLGALGIEGPVVVARPLPGSARSSELARGASDDRPTLLVTGDGGRAGNVAKVLVAVERLWREGLRHGVVVGADDLTEPAAALLAELAVAGRPIERLDRPDGEAAWRANAQAWAVVRPSLAGGLELAIVDALSAGTPVLTSGFGAMGELAAGGGVVTVDPCDDDALEAALRNVVLDTADHERLVREARSRSFPSWDEHAAAVWELAAGIRATRGGNLTVPAESREARPRRTSDPSALADQQADQQRELRALQAELAAMPSGSERLGARLEGLVGAVRHARAADAGRTALAKARQVAGRARTTAAPGAPVGPPSDDPGLRRRLRAATEALTGQGGDAGLAAFGRALATVTPSTGAWWSWAVVTATYPNDDELDALVVIAERGGPVALIAWVVEEHGRRLRAGTASERGLRAEPGAVLVDVTHTAAHDINTGVQRVTRGVAERWHADHGALLFGWSDSRTDAATLTDAEVARFSAWRERVGHDAGPVEAGPDTTADVLVPWKATVLIPELAAEPPPRGGTGRWLAPASPSGSASSGTTPCLSPRPTPPRRACPRRSPAT